ncbi:2'-5'-oligoadenylate synthase 1A [Holothuria leucospilota]|uniref:2'-5'-oligoadenylate synthase 1A n=1 Tax=Holothuria leucospilota TaxID=206669 RepID=A0A9Q0YQP6_HOLLE|nr:2'-5'-oligoadenylate synthase 1A [Holothuria leucospilota]
MSLRAELRSFAQNLAPSESEVRRAAENTDRITRAVHNHFRGRGIVDRITPFGSYAKKVSIRGNMDVDIIVYINGRDPPFDDVVKQLYSIVINQFTSSCRKDSYGVYFTFNDLKVDLLPARNFLPSESSHDPDVDRKARVQHRRALNYVKGIPERARDRYSTSLSFVSVIFEKERDSFSHSLSRLAKYWSFKVPVDGLKPRSSIMEYLAAYAADHESSSQDLLKGFQYFLKLFEFSDSLHIYWTEFYSEYDIPESLRRKRPLLLDPCNPFNNLLEANGVNNANCLLLMRPYARATLQRLEDAQQRLSQGGYIGIDEILQPDSSGCVRP